MKKMLATLVVVAVLAAPTAAVASSWKLVNTHGAYGKVKVVGWTKDYHKVAFVVDHPGTTIDIFTETDCSNGYQFTKNWTDGGSRFRYIEYGLPQGTRCTHYLIASNRKGKYMTAALYAA